MQEGHAHGAEVALRRVVEQGPFGDAARDELRDKVSAAFGRLRFYHPLAHLLVPSAFGLGLIAWALAGLSSVSASELLVIPCTYVFANAFEWRVHRDLLHKRSRLIPLLYERHTLMHHRVFLEHDMEIRGLRELGLVLIPPEAEVGVVLAALGPAAVAYAIGGEDAGRLCLATAIAYALSYEWLHLLFHLPATGPLGAVIARLRRHHARHHDPAHMAENLNVTVPLWDLVRGTVRP